VLDWPVPGLGWIVSAMARRALAQVRIVPATVRRVAAMERN
jgi:hypothetical protein